MTTKKLTWCQACWIEFLSKFNFVIFHTPSKDNAKADALTRQSNDSPSDNYND